MPAAKQSFEVSTGEQRTCGACKKEIGPNSLSICVHGPGHDSVWKDRSCFRRFAKQHGLKLKKEDFDGFEGLVGRHKEDVEKDIRKINTTLTFRTNEWTIQKAKGTGICAVCRKTIEKMHPQVLCSKERQHLSCTLLPFSDIAGSFQMFGGWSNLPPEAKEEVRRIMKRRKEEIENKKKSDDEEEEEEEEESGDEEEDDVVIDPGVKAVLRIVFRARSEIPTNLHAQPPLPDQNDDEEILKRYRLLNCRMTSVDRSSPDYRWIHAYIRNSENSEHQVRVELKNVIKLERANEAAVFNDTIGNMKALWHGSRTENIANILGRGLCIAPPGAVHTGAMFGRAMYFADYFGESLQYCRRKQGEDAFLFICIVALGRPRVTTCPVNPKETTDTKVCDSLVALGRFGTDKKGDQNHAENFSIPLGQPVVQIEGRMDVDLNVKFNEFVVKKADQVKMQYLVHVKLL